MAEELAVDVEEVPEEDYEAFEARMNANEGVAGEAPEFTAPAAGDTKTPSSEPVDAPEGADAGQIAEDSEATDDSEQEAEEAADPAEDPAEAADPGEKDTRLARRMRKLTGTIAELQTRLDDLQKGATDEEIPEEVASPPAVAAKGAQALKRPVLSDFEDTDTETAFDQYEAAKEVYQDAKTAALVAAAKEEDKAERTKERQEAALRESKAASDAAWSQAASRFPDFNEVLAKPEVVVSAPMMAVLRMDPAKGTELTYYLGQHPEECKAISDATVVIVPPSFGKEGDPAFEREGQRLWALAMAETGIRLGEIRAKLHAAPATPAKPPVTTPAKPGTATASVPGKPAPATPAPPRPQTKQVSSAHPPPRQVRTSGVAPAFDASSPDTPYETYEREMNAREARDGRR